MVDLQRIDREYYYKESERETPLMLEKIRESKLQEQYREYLAGYRGMDVEVLRESGMFYLLDGYEEFDEILESDVTRYILGLQTGDFVRQKERFIFPILDANGVILGFEGYDYEEDKYKYLMTLSVFAEKPNIFFNMQNIQKCYEEDVCILIEGLMDSVSLNSIDFKNNLGLLGKKLSEYHKRVLNRFSLVVIIPDKDIEGIKASEKWVEMIDTKVALLDIGDREVTRKRKVADEEGNIVEEEVVKDAKDIDDYIWGVEGSKEKLEEVYKKIKEESKSPFYTTKRYYI